jgi:Flp pilus assembly protein TadD
LSYEVPQISAVAQRMVAADGLERAMGQLEAKAGSGAKAQATQVVLAQLELGNGQNAEAVKRLRAAMGQMAADSPQRGPTQHLLGMALAGAGQTDEAVEVWRKVVQENPEDAQALNNLAFVLADQMDRGPEALPYAQKASQLQPRDTSIMDTLGWAQFKSGMLPEAVATLQQAVKSSPSAYVAYHLAVVLGKMEQTQAALQQLENAKALAQKAQDKDLLSKIEQQKQALDGAVQR